MRQERQLAAEADAVWRRSAVDVEAAKRLPRGATDNRLDPFHDHIDEAASILADLHSLNGNQVAEEISSLRRREQDQLLAGLAALVLGSTVALLLGRPGPADELTAMLRTVDTAGLTADARLTRGL
jgi:hypothetical protein